MTDLPLEQAAPAPRTGWGRRFLLRQWTELLDEPSFRRYWFMRLASYGASNALTYALLVFTVRQSSSAIATGFLLLTLIVPSALAPDESNWLLNPDHPDFKRIRFHPPEPFAYDARFFA